MTKESSGQKRVVPIHEGKRGQNVAKVTNNLVLPLALIEALVAGAACYLNYLLRYDPNSREDCSMVNWEGVHLLCSDNSYAAKPVYNETLSATTAVTFELPEWAFFTCAIVVPSSLVILVEIIKIFFSPKDIKVVMTGDLKLFPVIRRISRYICTFMMGGAVTGTLVSVLKLLIASPRPHFLAVCSPNATIMTDECGSGALWWSPYNACEGDEADVHEALRAFPSYHASLAAYCGIWTVVYLSTVARIAGIYNSTLLMAGAVSIMASIGTTHHLFIGLSSSNDVIAGGIIGAIVALYVTLVILNGFKERKIQIKVVRQQSPLDRHPNLLPIVPLHGTAQRNEVHFSNDLFGNDDLSIATNDPSPVPQFSLIPRANPHYIHRNGGPTSTPAQAVNSNISGKIPKPPPLPPYVPPPSYARSEALSSYNVPRQRFSAPPPSSQAPAYDESRNNVLNAYHSRDSDVVPRARTETASYF